MNYLSVCSGIEAATVAWHPLGWQAVGFSEIEAFPCALLKHYYPNVPNFGDLTKHEQWPIKPGSVDVLIGGTPCQSFSIAGLQKGLADPRGNLALIYLALVNRIRPRWVIWENVPGVLSSNKGRDFGSIIGGLVELGYGVAYRVLDAQFWGVAQRRRRVFVVGHFRGWQPAATVLFESESSTRNYPTRRKQEQNPTHDIARRIKSVGAGAANIGDIGGMDNIVAQISHPLSARYDSSEDGCRHGLPLVAWPAACGATLDASYGRLYGQDNQYIDGGASLLVAQTITSCNLKTQQTAGNNPGLVNGIISTSGVRRITPKEAERLQGFPDDYTLIPYPKKLSADGPRYKALGNSMAVPVIRWIGERIQQVTDLESLDV